MPKIKTSKIARKKFRVSANGRVKRGKAFTSHNTAKKSAKQKRQSRGLCGIEGKQVKTIKRMLPGC
jgi:large subunit ribosomal protein L35